MARAICPPPNDLFIRHPMRLKRDEDRDPFWFFLDPWPGDSPDGHVCDDSLSKLWDLEGHQECDLVIAPGKWPDVPLAAIFSLDPPTRVRSFYLILDELENRIRKALQDYNTTHVSVWVEIPSQPPK